MNCGFCRPNGRKDLVRPLLRRLLTGRAAGSTVIPRGWSRGRPAYEGPLRFFLPEARTSVSSRPARPRAVRRTNEPIRRGHIAGPRPRRTSAAAAGPGAPRPAAHPHDRDPPPGRLAGLGAARALPADDGRRPAGPPDPALAGRAPSGAGR